MSRRSSQRPTSSGLDALRDLRETGFPTVADVERSDLFTDIFHEPDPDVDGPVGVGYLRSSTRLIRRPGLDAGSDTLSHEAWCGVSQRRVSVQCLSLLADGGESRKGGTPSHWRPGTAAQFVSLGSSGIRFVAGVIVGTGRAVGQHSASAWSVWPEPGRDERVKWMSAWPDHHRIPVRLSKHHRFCGQHHEIARRLA